jgi:hypothetical protein
LELELEVHTYYSINRISWTRCTNLEIQNTLEFIHTIYNNRLAEGLMKFPIPMGIELKRRNWAPPAMIIYNYISILIPHVIELNT